MSISHVFDTYATTQKGRIMHFDVVLNEQNPAVALGYAREWLEHIGEGDAAVTLNTCVFCHSAEAPAALQHDIAQQGYAIIKMEGCPI
ncbi:MAG: DUF2024 family protein [Methylococcaceae bacterium]